MNREAMEALDELMKRVAKRAGLKRYMLSNGPEFLVTHARSEKAALESECAAVLRGDGSVFKTVTATLLTE